MNLINNKDMLKQKWKNRIVIHKIYNNQKKTNNMNSRYKLMFIIILK